MSAGLPLGHHAVRPGTLQRRSSAPFISYSPGLSSYSDLKASALSLFSSRRSSSFRNSADTGTGRSCNSCGTTTSGSNHILNRQSSARNIYRQPGSYARARANTNSNSPTQAWEARHHFYKKQFWCPEGDNDNDWLSTPPRRRALRESNSLDEERRGRNRPRLHSILKKSLTGLEYYDDLLDTEEQSDDKAGSRKHAQFRDDVDVIYFQQAEKTTSPGSRSQEKLKEDKCLYTVVQEGSLDSKNSPDSEEADTSDEENSRGNRRVPQRTLCRPEDIQEITDQEGNKKIQMFVRVGGEYVRNRTCVKAMSGGRKMLIMVYKYELGQNGGRYLHQYMEKVCLPQKIDPYHVKASMDRQGNLTIEASPVGQIVQNSPVSPDKPSR